MNIPRENRRLHFPGSLETVSLPSSVEVQQDSSVPMDANSALKNLSSSPNTPSRITSTSPTNHQELENNNVNSHARQTPREAGELAGQVKEHTIPSRTGNDHEGDSGTVALGECELEAEKLPVKKIRVILKKWDCRQCGVKEAPVAKVILHLRLALLSGKSISQALSTSEETSRYESWLRMRLSRDETYPLSIDRVRDEEGLLALLQDSEARQYRRKKNSIERARLGVDCRQSPPAVTPIHPPENEPPLNNQLINERIAGDPYNYRIAESTQFGINEFARLLIIIRDDENARSAVIAMGQDLSRSQLDAGVTRGDFWAIVESRFNDPSQRRHLSLAGAVDGVDSSLSPLAHRTSTFLKDKFNDAKADFTQYVTRWSASGQNDPDRFRNLLPKLPNGELNALGKRMMVMFVCTRKGTPYEEAHFSNVCTKFILGGAGRDEGSRLGSYTGERRETGPRKKRAQPDAEGVKVIATSLSKLPLVMKKRETEMRGAALRSS